MEPWELYNLVGESPTLQSVGVKAFPLSRDWLSKDKAGINAGNTEP
jgi:hypothetical protein